MIVENVASVSNVGAASPFIKEMVRQLRALDSYGQYDGWKDERVLEPLILTAQRKAEIPLVGDPDETTLSRVKAFYNAVAVRIETTSKLLSVPLVHLTHEGFGRALISTGKLIILDRTLRDVHRFGFSSLEALDKEGEKLIASALAVIERFPQVAEA
jgi:probable nitrogen fixation protein